MTPSAYRLLGLIQHRSARPSVTWIKVNLSEIAGSVKLSERTLKRAKAELDGYGLVKFRTVSTGEGRGHKLHACLPSKLVGKRNELLHQSRTGKARISRTKVGGKVIHKPRLKPRPRDTSNTIGSRSEHKVLNSITVKRSLGTEPSRKQVALAHWMKHELWRRHSWDNCKVMKSDAHAFGFALRAIKAGFDIEAIHKAFEAALRTMHGTATDVGLNSGQPTNTLFCLSSTVSLAQRLLKKSAPRQHEPNPRSGSGSSRNRAPTLHHKPARQRALVPSQSARFAYIAYALA
jgi:hypothetical protein